MAGLLDDPEEGRRILEQSGDPRFAPAPGGDVQPQLTPPLLTRLWQSLPPEVRNSYGSLAGFIGELSPGAAIRDTLQQGGELTQSLLQGHGWDAAGHGAGLLTAMAGVVPVGRAAGKIGKGVQEAASVESRLPRGTEFRVTPHEDNVGYTVSIHDKDASAWADPHYQMIVGETNKAGVAPVEEAFNVTGKHKGLGDAMYEKAIEYAREQGIRLTGFGSEAAQKVWDRLTQRGLAEKVGDQYVSTWGGP